MIRNFLYLIMGLNPLLQAQKSQKLGLVWLEDGFKSGKSRVSYL